MNGTRVADALSSSSESAINHIPIYLSTCTKLPIALPTSVKEIMIYGGTGVVSNSLVDSLKAKGITVKRIAGSTRYLTNLEALKQSQIDNDHYIFVRGTSVKSTKEDYPDAVAASGLAQRLGAKVVLLD